MKNFAITGVGGYIAPRHLKAIKDTGNHLIAAVDPNDSVGIIDRYFPDAAFFTEIERFDRHLEKLKRSDDKNKIDYLSICSPNNLHDAHIRLALRLGADAICEKPLVLNPWNLDALEELEAETGKRVYTILQLRVHPALIELKKKYTEEDALNNGNKKHNIVLNYITSRGPWYHYSWKGMPERSGGLATNIGVHFFDLLLWLFGDAQESVVTISDGKKMGGILELKNATVKWFLSIDRSDLPREAVEKSMSTYRSIIVDGNEIEFTEGFTDLHTKVYEETLAGRGFGIEDVRPSIKLVQELRVQKR
jgi:Predicted dehydrogenases and related proteins